MDVCGAQIIKSRIVVQLLEKYDEATYQCGNTLAFGNVVNQGAMTNVVVNTKLVLATAK